MSYGSAGDNSALLVADTGKEGGFQQASAPPHSAIAAGGPTNRYAVNSENQLRLFWGHDYKAVQAGDSVAVYINDRDFEMGSVRDAVAVSNAVYGAVFKYLFLLLSYTFGLVLAILIGAWFAMFSFAVEYWAKPFIKMMTEFGRLFGGLARVLADAFRPIFALFMPWNKH